MVACSLLGKGETPKRVMLAVLDYVHGKGPQPKDLIEGELCEIYHCLPSQLDKEDAFRIIRQRRSVGLARTLRKPSIQWTPAEWAAAGEALDLDMERQKRAARE